MSSFIIQIVLGLLIALGGVTYTMVATQPNYLIVTFLYALAVILIALAIAKVFKSNEGE